MVCTLPLPQVRLGFYAVFCLVVEGREEVDAGEALNVVDGVDDAGERHLLAVVAEEEGDGLGTV